MKNISPTFVYMLLDNNNLNDIACALVHADKPTKEHIPRCSKNWGIEDELTDLIKEHSNITIQKSNQMKTHIMNALLDSDYVKYKRGAKGTGTGGLFFG